MSAPAYLLRFLALSALGALLLALELAPRSAGAPAPDLLFCLFGAVALARPVAAPLAAPFLLGLARDLLIGGPLGVGALGLLLALELLRAAPTGRRAHALRWLAAVLALALGLAATCALMALSAAPLPGPEALAARLFATALLFPLFMALVALAPRLGREARA